MASCTTTGGGTREKFTNTSVNYVSLWSTRRYTQVFESGFSNYTDDWLLCGVDFRLSASPDLPANSVFNVSVYAWNGSNPVGEMLKNFALEVTAEWPTSGLYGWLCDCNITSPVMEIGEKYAIETKCENCNSTDYIYLSVLALGGYIGYPPGSVYFSSDGGSTYAKSASAEDMYFRTKSIEPPIYYDGSYVEDEDVGGGGVFEKWNPEVHKALVDEWKSLRTIKGFTSRSVKDFLIKLKNLSYLFLRYVFKQPLSISKLGGQV